MPTLGQALFSFPVQGQQYPHVMCTVTTVVNFRSVWSLTEGQVRAECSSSVPGFCSHPKVCYTVILGNRFQSNDQQLEKKMKRITLQRTFNNLRRHWRTVWIPQAQCGGAQDWALGFPASAPSAPISITVQGSLGATDGKTVLSCLRSVTCLLPVPPSWE